MRVIDVSETRHGRISPFRAALLARLLRWQPETRRAPYGRVANDNADTKNESCPIPRCALEYILAILSIIVGCAIGLFGDHRLGIYLLYNSSFTVALIKSLWGGMLIFVGLMQLVALHVGGFGPQRWAAFAASLAWFALTYACIAGSLLAVGMPTSLIAALAEFYIFAMLRGARWRR